MCWSYVSPGRLFWCVGVCVVIPATVSGLMDAVFVCVYDTKMYINIIYNAS